MIGRLLSPGGQQSRPLPVVFLPLYKRREGPLPPSPEKEDAAAECWLFLFLLLPPTE